MPFFVSLMLSESFEFPSPWEFCPADNAKYTTIHLFCKKHYRYVDILIEGIGLHSLPENPTTLTDFCNGSVGQRSIGSHFLWEYRQIKKSSIRLTFNGFKRCTKIPINTNSLRVHKNVRPSLYPFFSSRTHILNGLQKKCKTTLSKKIEGSIRCGSSSFSVIVFLYSYI